MLCETLGLAPGQTLADYFELHPPREVAGTDEAALDPAVGAAIDHLFRAGYGSL